MSFLPFPSLSLVEVFASEEAKRAGEGKGGFLFCAPLADSEIVRRSCSRIKTSSRSVIS